MEKMLKNNNGLTMLNTILLCGSLWFIYQVDAKVNSLERQVTAVRHALYYQLHIRTDAPERNNFPDETGVPVPDVILSQTTTTGTKKD